MFALLKQLLCDQRSFRELDKLETGKKVPSHVIFENLLSLYKCFFLRFTPLFNLKQVKTNLVYRFVWYHFSAFSEYEYALNCEAEISLYHTFLERFKFWFLKSYDIWVELRMCKQKKFNSCNYLRTCKKRIDLNLKSTEFNNPPSQTSVSEKTEVNYARC